MVQAPAAVVLFIATAVFRACLAHADGSVAVADAQIRADDAVANQCDVDTQDCPSDRLRASSGPSLLQWRSNSGNQPASFSPSGMQLDASVIRYEPEAWNGVLNVAKSHNCYEYALNDVDRTAASKCEHVLEKGQRHSKCRKWFHIPGFYWQSSAHRNTPMKRYRKSTADCHHVLERVKRDNRGVAVWKNSRGSTLEHDDECPASNQYMAALVVDPDMHSFHFYRRDHACLETGQTGLCWSHKPGILNVTRFDSSGNEISDLRKADRRWGKHKKKLYKDICGYFCLPGNQQKSTHSAFFEKNPRRRNYGHHHHHRKSQ
eukprot:gnl/TRDRNA2_/TRDRNA2_38095_c0_seq1.p1 gnl/TRDRNA2_/TRDRNA2_38095_c0~~gnl/TRDRNA2_/TRDRNA2_38095_c0_seq1.p1  ORF type:complete len:363 (-),score=41.26 gnl/TRDRNA2_/TRDRNA2_38095_c0_seq1:86-1039(-)